MDKLVISNLLRSIMNKSRESMEQRVKGMDISPQQGRMISYIVQNEDKGLIQKDLAEVFQRRGASITSMLQGLEKKGYIERRIPENNERQKNIFVLPKGKALVDETNEAFYAAEKELVHALNEDEVQQLTELLRKIDRSL
ncbi:MAG: MarR family winged helix-turn-helix transcriptional regulator [Enterococcus avium]|uniref:MarR family winged helix-turn-helix transcriptional regulator n=1 Tax=Enterococcus avium TaxID=33945 RepID=UPI00232C7E06|nr:MarR family transcriptional regulator [Enterococcus avium]MDB1748610.1 MarR family transcriptional regulator [Enterococcus avium]MDB1753233.1 MarR family transcriptional regulator [Enterococcus avium]MDB1760603.1 MarR family transcriptional regulator [Enterococcus avium]